jgi:Tfp pilus assembly protein PilF
MGLIDLAPTILQFLGVPRPAQFQGESLSDLVNSRSGVGSREVYGESVYAKDHLGCSALRSLRLGRYKYIDTPKAELYDLQSDPGEIRNLYPRETSLAQALHQQLLKLRGRFAASRPAPTTEQSVETRALLGSLGYTELAYPRGAPDDSRCDPKDRLAEYHLYGRAVAEAQTGNYKGAVERFSQVLAQDPQHVLSHYYLAVSYFHLDSLDDAVKELRRTLELSPSYAPAGELLGTIWLKKGDYERAQEQFQQLLKVAPHDYGANYNLGLLATRKGQFQEAIRYLRAAVEADPQSPAAHNALGTAYRRAGDPRQAEIEFKRATSLQP